MMASDWPFLGLTPMKYGVILADPPWAYVMRSPKGHAKSPEAHYQTMSAEDLRRLPVGQLAGPDCLLFMWSTWPHLGQAFELLRAWGFTYVTGGSWLKRTKHWNVAFGSAAVTGDRPTGPRVRGPEAGAACKPKPRPHPPEARL